MTENKEISQEMRDLVVARLKTLPTDREISIGADGEFTKEQLIEHVEKEDEIGLKMIEVEMSFLRALKEGTLFEQ